MNTGQWIVIVLCIIIGLWYAVGFYYNRRKSRTIANWLYAGLSQFGDVKVSRLKSTSAWGAQFQVNCNEDPFRHFDVLFYLEARENLPLWIYNRLQGKRDEIILRAKLMRAPALELEAAYNGDSKFKNMVYGEYDKPYEWIPGHPRITIARRGRKDIKPVADLRDLMEKFRGGISRVSLQKKAPHLIVKADLSSLRAEPAEKFLEDIRGFVGSFMQ